MPAPVPYMGEKGERSKREEMAFKWFTLAVSLLSATTYNFVWVPELGYEDFVAFLATMIVCYVCRMMFEAYLKLHGCPCTDTAVLLNRRLNKWFGWHLPA